MSDTLHLLVCRYYLREAQMIVQGEGFEDVEVSAYPDLCVHPQADEMEVVQRLCDRVAREGRTVILVGACFMLRNGCGLPAESRHFQIYQMDLCFYMMLPRDLVDFYMRDGAYIVSPGWLEQWRYHMDRWCFDQPTARAFFAESTRKLVLLDTGVDPLALDNLRACAEFIDLPAEVLPVGLEYFRLTLKGLVQDWRVDQEVQRAKDIAEQANRKLADHVLAFELLTDLTLTMSEDEAITSVLDLFAMVFGAGSTCYAPFVDGRLGLVSAKEPGDGNANGLQAWVDRFAEDDSYVVGDSGFCVRIGRRDKTRAFILVEKLAFPDRIPDYLNLALAVVDICGLAISRARALTERFRAEEALQQKTEELARSNSDLEQFAYVASHDLQEPLRKIISFGKLVEDQAAGSLDEEARDYLRRMADAAARMQRLIGDLLEYSRVGRGTRESAPVNLQKIVRLAVDDLETRINETRGDVIVDDLPMVTGDQQQLYQLMLNVIGNSLKFHREGVPPVVRVSARHLPGGWVEVRVEDNGVGFEGKHAEEIFQPFRRLHTRAEYSGTGIGLAVCKKIIVLHGGQIVAAGSPDGGAVFTFTLPECVGIPSE